MKEQIRELKHQVSELYAEDMLEERAVLNQKKNQKIKGKEVSDIG